MFTTTNTQFRECSLLCKGKYHFTADLQENGSFFIWQFFYSFEQILMLVNGQKLQNKMQPSVHSRY